MVKSNNRTAIFLIYLALSLLSKVTFAQNQLISQGTIFEGEPYLAINPLDHSKMVVAWMGFQLGQKVVIKTSRSIDGGISWSVPQWLAHSVSGNTSADVSLAYALNGDLYMSYVDYDDAALSNGAVYFRKSMDNGATWSSPVEVISSTDCPDKYCVDRPWMVVDNTGGPNSGTIYITTMNADQAIPATPPYNPYLTISTDGGTTFQTPRFIDTLGYYSGSSIKQPMPSPAVGADGKFYAMYPAYEPATQGPFAHLFLAHSTTAGINIDHIDAYSGVGSTADPLLKKGAQLIADPSNSAHLAYLYVFNALGDADIYIYESFNSGLNWNAPMRINQDATSNGKQQDLVWADFDTDGDLVVCWRDRRTGAGNDYAQPTQIYARIRWKDSVNFSNEFQISDAIAPHQAVLEGAGNDFMNVKFVNDTIYAVWGDVRSGSLKIYLNRYAAITGTSELFEVASELLPVLNIYPNPTQDIINWQKEIVADSYVIYSTNGTIIKECFELKENSISVKHLPNGNYYLVLKNKKTTLVASFKKI